MYLVERQGLLERDVENSYLTAPSTPDEDDPLPHLLGSSITYRVAYGSQQGRKVFTLQTLPPDTTEEPRQTVSGFSLHAGVATKAHDREKLERICRYIARPAIAEQRLSLTQLDFISKLAALVPKPRVNLTRYHGVFAPNSKYRERITPAKRGKGSTAKEDANTHVRTPAEQHVAMTWAQRLKRVFGIDMQTCECGGTIKVIACIEDRAVIKRILDHLDKRETKYQQTSQHRQPSSRAPPMQG